MRLGILGSTRGTLLTALFQAIDSGELRAEIAVVLSNKAESGILAKAADRGIQGIYIPVNGLERADYDMRLHQALLAAEVDLVVLIGYMRLLSAEFVKRWPAKIINIHPSLLPAYAGLMDRAVHAAVLENGDPVTGCTVHWVTEAVDAGPIILQQQCPVLPNDSIDSLRARVQALEGPSLIQAIQLS